MSNFSKNNWFIPTPERELSKPGIRGAGSRLVWGFTLIETLITLMVVSIMMTLIGSIFGQSLALERRVVWAQKVQENSTFLLEAMAREIRVSAIANQDSIDCFATSLNMVHPVIGNISYSLQGGNIQKQVGSATTNINSYDVQITRLKFCITGSGTNDNQSPKVTIIMSMKNLNGTPAVSVDVETTVISRDISTEILN